MNGKKRLLIFLCAAMVLPLVACNPTPVPDDTESVEESTAPEETIPEGESEDTTPADDTRIPAESVEESESESESETEEYLGVNLLKDPTFQNGFQIINTAENGGGVAKVLPGRDGSTDKASWMLVQWWNNHLLQNGVETVTDTTYSVVDGSKDVLIDWERGMVSLGLDASKELDGGPAGQEWPHLGIEQILEPVPLKDMESMTVTMDFNIVESEARRPGSLIHAQFSWCLYLADLNPESEGYGNFIWFGLSIFNSNTISTSLYHAQDTAGGPGNYIYTLGSSSFLDKRLWPGHMSQINCDMLPFVEAALKMAQEDGFMLGTEVDDLYLTGTSLGWEIFDCWDETVTVENIGIYVK